MNSLHLITRGSTLIQWERVVNFQEKNGEDVRRCFFLLLLPSSSPITTFRLIAIDYESWPRRQKYQGSANYRRAKSSPASWRKERERRRRRRKNDVTVHGATIFLKQSLQPLFNPRLQKIQSLSQIRSSKVHPFVYRSKAFSLFPDIHSSSSSHPRLYGSLPLSLSLFDTLSR